MKKIMRIRNRFSATISKKNFNIFKNSKEKSISTFVDILLREYFDIPQEKIIAKKEDEHICSKCKTAKKFSEFHKSTSNKNGLSSHCKTCLKATRENNITVIKFKAKIYREKNKELFKSKRQEKEAKAKRKEYNKNYYKKNKKEQDAYNKQYKKDNKKTVNKNNNKRVKDRLKNDLLFKLTSYLRGLIRNSIKSKGFSKKTRVMNS